MNGARAMRSIVLIALLTASACARREPDDRGASRFPEPPARERSSILLVTLDTFRGDFFGAAGDPVARTPFIDRLARQGVQFADAFAGSPMTLPSHASILTGLESPAHGVHDNGTFRLPENIPTLATALRDRGFRTAAFLGAFPLDARFGLARGFETYDDDVGSVSGPSGLRMAERSGVEVVSRAGAWIRERSAAERWLAWTHLYDPHVPHEPPPPYSKPSGTDDYRADLAWTDAIVGRLVREVAGRESNPWIVLLADHGESRGDHGEATHGVFVYDSSLRIPAIVWPAPDSFRPGVRASMMRTIDVPATIFPLLGIPAADAPGAGLDALTKRPTFAFFESRYAYLHFGWAPLSGVRSEEWKLVIAPETELYHLPTDPQEFSNAAAKHPEVVDELLRIARRARASEVSSARVTPDEESRSALVSLGYVVGDPASNGSNVSPGRLPDPKAMIVVQSLLDSGVGLLSAGRSKEALAPLRSALSRDPRNKEVRQLLGVAYAALGRNSEAIEQLVRCLELPPHDNDRIPRFELASAYLRARRPGDAARELKKILDTDPGDAPTWYNLGLARDMEGDLPSARRAWNAALEADPGYHLAQQALARVGSSTRD